MASEKSILLPSTLDTLPLTATVSSPAPTPPSSIFTTKPNAAQRRLLSIVALWSIVMAGVFTRDSGLFPDFFDAISRVTGLGEAGQRASEMDLKDICVQPEFGSGKPSNWSRYFDDVDVQEKVIQRLSKAITFPTQSFDIMPPPSLDSPLWAPFTHFRSWLSKEFPTLHKIAEVEVLEYQSLIFTIQGTDKDLRPLMLTAHMDVVPAVTSLDRWTFPPFSGTIQDGLVYGRGSSDCKNTLIALLTSHEYLLSNGFKPKRTIILAFGQDEEVGGPIGAGAIGKRLEERYGEGGIGMIVDEGGMGVSEVYGATFALPGLAEKGSGNFIIQVDTLGGHSSIPSHYTSIGLLSKIISLIEDRTQLFLPIIRPPSPMWGYMQCAAKYGNPGETPDWVKSSIKGKGGKGGKVEYDYELIGEEFAKSSDANRYLLQTSKAVTLISGGNKVNALPESAVANINSRIDIFSNADEVAAVYLGVIGEIAEKYALNVNGKQYAGGPSIGNVSLRIDSPTAPSPITSSTSIAYMSLAKAVQAAFGPEVVTAPNAMTGNTDTRHYNKLSEHIFRFSPIRGEYRTGSRAHTVDERMAVSAHIEAIRFFIDMVMQADEAGADL